jgi:hypothetical protein
MDDNAPAAAFLVSFRPPQSYGKRSLGKFQVGHVESHKLGPPECAGKAHQQQRAIACGRRR